MSKKMLKALINYFCFYLCELKISTQSKNVSVIVFFKYKMFFKLFYLFYYIKVNNNKYFNVFLFIYLL